MQSIDQAFEELRALHQQLTNAPAPEIGPHAFLPFPPGLDPVACAIEEVAQLKRFVEKAQSAGPQGGTPAWVPPSTIYASETGVRIFVELPGVRREDISVTATAGTLLLRGQRRPPSFEGDLKPVLVEQAWGSFERVFALPAWCDADDIAAIYEQGVLEIRMSRNAESGTGPVQVQIS